MLIIETKLLWNVVHYESYFHWRGKIDFNLKMKYTWNRYNSYYSTCISNHRVLHLGLSMYSFFLSKKTFMEIYIFLLILPCHAFLNWNNFLYFNLMILSLLKINVYAMRFKITIIIKIFFLCNCTFLVVWYRQISYICIIWHFMNFLSLT